MNRLLLAVALFMLPATGMTGEDRGGALLRLMEQIPAGAHGIVSLSDIAAARRQIIPFIQDTPEPTRALVPYTPLYSGQNGFDMSAFGAFATHGASAALGFSIFEITGLAAWGELPAAPVILTGVADRAGSIEAALAARGFEATDYSGHRVWHRGRDFETDREHRGEDPFSLRFNSSQRFAVKDGFVLFSRSWPVMHDMLDAGASLADDRDAAAILHAGYGVSGAGDLIEAVLLSGQPEAASSAVPGLPPFARYGLLRWQNGATMTGAIAIPYQDAAIAHTARDRFTARLDALKAQSVGRPLSDILPWPRRIEIAEVSGRAVLIFGFQSEADMSQPVNLLTFMRSPGRRLVEMLRNHDLNMLIGHSK